jgi:hypothetical protein
LFDKSEIRQPRRCRRQRFKIEIRSPDTIERLHDRSNHSWQVLDAVDILEISLVQSFRDRRRKQISVREATEAASQPSGQQRETQYFKPKHGRPRGLEPPHAKGKWTIDNDDAAFHITSVI